MPVTSQKLSAERIAEIKAFKGQPDPECPELTDEDFARMRPRNPQAFWQAIEEARLEKEAKPVEVKLTPDVIEWLQNAHVDSSKLVNRILREAIRFSRIAAAL
jgi:uncharacterized protein (DUF4415 family)